MQLVVCLLSREIYLILLSPRRLSPECTCSTEGGKVEKGSCKCVSVLLIRVVLLFSATDGLFHNRKRAYLHVRIFVTSLIILYSPNSFSLPYLYSSPRRSSHRVDSVTSFVLACPSSLTKKPISTLSIPPPLPPSHDHLSCFIVIRRVYESFVFLPTVLTLSTDFDHFYLDQSVHSSNYLLLSVDFYFNLTPPFASPLLNPLIDVRLP